MKQQAITIEKSSIYDEVLKQSAYVGAKSLDENGNSLYSRMLATEEDKPMLDSYILEAANDVGTLMQPIFESSSQNESTVDFNITLSDRYNTKLVPLLKATVLLYLATYPVLKWLQLHGSPHVTEYQEQIAKLEKELKSYIYYKNEPARPVKPHVP